MDSAVREVRSWKLFAQDLGFEFESPYVLEHSGSQHTFLGHLPHFGSEFGMLLMLVYDGAAAEAASERGFGYSCVELDGQVDREGVIEMLQDWGWTAAAPAPRWYGEVNV